MSKEEFEELEAMEFFIDLWEENSPEKYQNKPFSDQGKIEKDRKTSGQGWRRHHKGHDYEIDKGGYQSPVCQKCWD